MGLYLRTFRLFKSSKMLVFLLVILSVPPMVVSMCQPLMTKILIDVVFAKKESFWTIYNTLFVISLLFFLQMTSGTFKNYATFRLEQDTAKRLQRDLYAHLQSLGPKFYKQYRPGMLHSRLFGGSGSTVNLLKVLINNGLSVTSVITSTSIMFATSPSLACITFVVLPIYYLIFVNTEMRNKYFMKQSWNARDTLSNLFHERLRGIKQVQIFNKEHFEVSRYDTTAEMYFDAQEKTNTNKRKSSFLTSTFSHFGGLLIWVVGGTLVFHGKMSVGSLIAFQAYAGMNSSQFMSFIGSVTSFSTFKMELERTFELFDAKPEIENGQHTVELKECRGEVEFKNVGFSYVTEKKESMKEPAAFKKFYLKLTNLNETEYKTSETFEALKNISFKASPGEVIALVGPSGSGKSSIAQLISRFSDPSQGIITIDGTPMKDCSLMSLRQHISFVTQENFLFSGTIFENIAYGKEGATLDEVMDAAKKASAHEFIMKMKDGYQTVVGEDGENLSGGQKQRISIARSLIKNPKILILDEATASLDAIAEHEILNTVWATSQNRVTFMITHRLQNIQGADKILVINDGRIAEMGTHQELINKPDGLYKNMYKKQTKYEVLRA